MRVLRSGGCVDGVDELPATIARVRAELAAIGRHRELRRPDRRRDPAGRRLRLGMRRRHPADGAARWRHGRVISEGDAGGPWAGQLVVDRFDAGLNAVPNVGASDAGPDFASQPFAEAAAGAKKIERHACRMASSSSPARRRSTPVAAISPRAAGCARPPRGESSGMLLETRIRGVGPAEVARTRSVRASGSRRRSWPAVPTTRPAAGAPRSSWASHGPAAPPCNAVVCPGRPCSCRWPAGRR